MIIHVPKSAQSHFWDEPPEGRIEFWAFRYKPECKKGDLLEFYFGGTKVAEATVAAIASEVLKFDAAGFPILEHKNSGKFKDSWKVFWLPETFRDLRYE